MIRAETVTVSIGLPVYNGQRYLAQAIEALLGQTFKDLELVISDNASSDRTAEICQAYAARDGRVRYYRSDTNRGPAWNYRNVFALAAGRYFRWATHDDVSDSTSVGRCVDVLEQEPDAVLAYPRTRLIDENGAMISEFEDRLHLPFDRPIDRFVAFERDVKLANAIYGLIRSAALRRTALMRDFIGSDVALLGELTLHGKFIEVPEVLFSRRIHGAAYSSLKSTEERLSWYQAKSNRRADWSEWRLVQHNIAAVLRAPLGLGERLAIWRYVARMALWRRRELLSEVLTAARGSTRRT